MEKKKTERLVANLKDNESYLLEHCLKQSEGMSAYLKRLVIDDMNGISKQVDENLVAKKLLDMVFTHNYSLVAPSYTKPVEVECGTSTDTSERLTENEVENIETQDFDDWD